MKGIPALLSLAACALAGSSPVAAQDAVKPITVLQDSSPVMYGRSAKIKAVVEAVDLQARAITLKGAKDWPLTMRVEQRVRTLPEVQVGDEVTVRYHESVALELRKTVDGDPAYVEQMPATDPAAEQNPAAPRRITVIAAVDAVSVRGKSATLKDAAGNFVELYVRDTKVLEALAPGDQVIATYTEAAVVAIDLPKDKEKDKDKGKKKKRK